MSDAILSFLSILQMEKAVEILDEMALAGVSPDEHTFTTIMHGYAALGDTGKAFEYFTKLRNEGLELDVYAYEALLKACCKSGRMQSALAVTKEMCAQKIRRNTFVYNILIDGYVFYADIITMCFLTCFFSHGLEIIYFLVFLLSVAYLITLSLLIWKIICNVNHVIIVDVLPIIFLLFIFPCFLSQFFSYVDGLEEVMFGRLLILCNK